MRPELERVNARLEKVNAQLDEVQAKTLEAKSNNIEQNVHAGPIVYISQAFNVSVEEASKYIILIIVAVFDPLAVLLVLAANMLIKKRNEEPTPEPPATKLTPSEPSPTPPPQVEPKPLEESVNVQAERVVDHATSVDPTPAIDVATETAYSGAPQTEFMHRREPTILPAQVEKQGMVLKK
jgi:hypothetical protein